MAKKQIQTPTLQSVPAGFALLPCDPTGARPFPAEAVALLGDTLADGWRPLSDDGRPALLPDMRAALLLIERALAHRAAEAKASRAEARVREEREERAEPPVAPPPPPPPAPEPAPEPAPAPTRRQSRAARAAERRAAHQSRYAQMTLDDFL